jgi:hypothetical protein
MKRIYISFFTTVTIALTMTLVAFITRNNMSHVVTMDKNTQHIQQDSTFSGFQNSLETFN